MRRFRGGEDGVSAIEFALIAPALILVLIGVFEVAGLVFSHWSLESAAFEAARYGSTGFAEAGVTREQRIAEIVEDRSLGFIDTADLLVETRIYPDYASLRNPADAGAPGPGGPDDIVLYSVSAVWRPMTPLFSAFMDPVMLEKRVPVLNEPF